MTTKCFKDRKLRVVKWDMYNQHEFIFRLREATGSLISRKFCSVLLFVNVAVVFRLLGRCKAVIRESSGSCRVVVRQFLGSLHVVSRQ